MDKKYFVKYLPVEGRYAIKLNDNRFVDEKSNYFPENSTFLSYKYMDFEYIESKLFLCSRDIQVGDKNIYNRFDKLHISTGINQYCIDNELENFGLYKVIGPISPQALWVKEGDEFEEEDIKLLKNGGNDSPERFKRVQIKCQNCKTFH